ncbi:Nucleotide/sugar transporter family protein [Prunus dulcis]|uniref:Nucleotide/sugar transporter family protein n=1 Tax=Prunus dulcis TaxID=3755 RepID=A0A4Y1RVX9_PRUDU|nr:Nucleotide/sugar transporter family protein [Prunus dulcis]
MTMCERVCESVTVRKKGRVWLAMDAESNQKLPVSSSSQSQERLKKGPKMTRKGAYAAISYMASAVLLIMFNKAALSSYNFPSTNVITLFQMLSSCTLLYAMKCWKIISFTTEPQITTNNPVTLIPFKTLVHTLPLAISYLLYMLVTMASVRGKSSGLSTFGLMWCNVGLGWLLFGGLPFDLISPN